MTLHCLYASPESTAALRCRAALAPGDAVLLLGAAVRLADPAHPALPQWGGGHEAALYALQEDLAAHGVAPAPLVTAVDYAGWVRLSEELPRQQVWT